VFANPLARGNIPRQRGKHQALATGRATRAGVFTRGGAAVRARGKKDFTAMRAMPGVFEEKGADEKFVPNPIRERRRALEVRAKHLARKRRGRRRGGGVLERDAQQARDFPQGVRGKRGVLPRLEHAQRRLRATGLAREFGLGQAFFPPRIADLMV